jgi:hypothetical protein
VSTIGDFLDERFDLVGGHLGRSGELIGGVAVRDSVG